MPRADRGAKSTSGVRRIALPAAAVWALVSLADPLFAQPPEPGGEPAPATIAAVPDAPPDDADAIDAPEVGSATSTGSAELDEDGFEIDTDVEAIRPDGPLPDATLEVFQEADTKWWLSLNHIVAQRIGDDDLEEALATRGYGGGAPAFGGEFTALRRLTKWLGLGARLGVRHRHWNHFHVDPATMFGVDLQLVVQARWVARFGDIGVDLAGGLALVGLRLNDVTDFRVAGRAQAGPMVAIHLFGPLRALVRFGYDFYQREYAGFRMNSGGVYFAVGFEVRE